MRAHVAEWPRDALVLSLATGVFGLIGFSGSARRNEEARDLLDGLARHCADDWHLALFALADDRPAQREVFEDTLLAAYLATGRTRPAEVLLRRRLATRPSARDERWLARAAGAPTAPWRAAPRASARAPARAGTAGIRS